MKKSEIEFLDIQQASGASNPAEVVHDSTAFDEVWTNSLDKFGDGLEPANSILESSQITKIALQQAASVHNAYLPLDANALREMSAIQVMETITAKKIAMDNSSTEMNMGWGLIKSVRQAFDTILNSK